jgi:spore germination protein YaaH
MLERWKSDWKSFKSKVSLISRYKFLL